MTNVFPMVNLTPNTPLIHTSFTYSKWNMYLKLIFWAYLKMMVKSGLEKIFMKSLHAQEVFITKKFSNKNDLLCPWMDSNKMFCDVCTYNK